MDQFHPYLAVLDKARTASDKYERITGGDAVHPGPAGQALMAASILKGLNFPAQVAAVEVDAATGKATGKNCKVTTDVAVKDGGVSFEQLDEALPFFPPQAASILKWAPLLEELNDYRLTVKGLAEGNYAVMVGGTKVAEYPAADLAKGVNLAGPVLKDGPIAEQVKAVQAAVENKNKFHHDQIFRGVVLAGIPDWLKLPAEEIEQKRKAAFMERMDKLPDLDAALRGTLAMKPHTVEVVPVKK